MFGCRVVPFPMTRRVIVKNLARQLFCYRPETVERTLGSQLEFQRQSLLRKGVTPDAVKREIAALEYARACRTLEHDDVRRRRGVSQNNYPIWKANRSETHALRHRIFTKRAKGCED